VTRPTPTTPPYTPPTAQPANSNATFGGGSSTFGMPTVTIPRQGDEAAERPQAPATRPTFPNAGGSGRPGEITAPPNQNQNQNPNQNQNQRPER
jgi:hypothetical protein